MESNKSLANLISKDINNDFGYGEYLNCKVIIKKSNGYINVTKLCDMYGKRFENWKRNKTF